MTEASVSFAGNLTDDPELRHEELGPSLRWATTTTRTTRSSSQ